MSIATQLRDQQSSRCVAYLMLAQAFRLPGPGSELGQTLQRLHHALLQLASEACQQVGPLQKSLQDMDEETLKTEYSRLFLGPFLAPAPPYGSVYLEKGRRLMGESTVDVRNRYLAAGMDVAPGFKDAPDHIRAELEFMHVLISRGLTAIDAAEHALLSELIDQQRAFLKQHLGAWLPAFAERAAEHARAGFYRHLAALASAFVTEDLEALPCCETAACAAG